MAVKLKYDKILGQLREKDIGQAAVSGDMLKSVYDIDGDGIVDHAAVADAVGATTAAQVADAVGKAHIHANKATLDKFGEENGKPTYDGAEIGGGSGTVRSVNGQLPDESGNVTVETGSTVDESRLLPDPASVSVDSNGNPVVFIATSAGLDASTLLYLPFDSNAADQSSYKCSVSALEDGMLFIDPNHKKFGEASLWMSGDSSSSTAKKLIATLSAPLANSDFTIHGWIRVTDEYYQRALFTFQETGNNGKYESGDYSSNCFSVVFWSATRILLVPFSGNGNANLNYAGADIQNVNLNEWVHVAFTRSANTFFVFVNGKLTITKSATESLPEYIAIGNYGGSESAIHNINGNIDEFIILNYAKWTEDFDVPTQPASTLVKSYGVSDKTPVTSDSPRLLPENPANGDIPCYNATATTGGGNDSNTAALLHLIEVPPVDTAAGNSAPLLITTSGTAAQNTETPKFGSSCVKLTSGCIKIPVDDAKFAAKNWAASLWFRPINTNTTFVMGHDADNNGGGWNVQWGSEGFKLFNRAGTSSPWKSAAANAWHWLAVVKNGGQLLFYVDGAKIGELANVEASCVMTIGAKSDDANYYPITGDVQEFRLQYLGDDELSGWTGSTIPVQAAPYSKPQAVGEWGKLNKSELIQSVNGITPDSAGAVTIPLAGEQMDGSVIDGLISGTSFKKLVERFVGIPNTPLLSSVDLNTMTEIGFYAVSNPTNAPTDTGYYYLLVHRWGQGAVYNWQLACNVQTYEIFTRNTQGPSTWSSWTKLIQSSDRATTTIAGLMSAADKVKLDGLNIIESNNTLPNGYFKLPGGTIVQWGAVSNITADGTTQITFPVAFPNAFFIGNATAVSGTGTASGVIVSLTATLPTGMILIVANDLNGSADINVHWLAIGY